MIRTIVCFALVGLLAGCHVGPRIEQMAFARDPAGAEVAVSIELRQPQYQRKRYAGELLEVSASDGMLVAVRGAEIAPRLTWFRWNAVHEVNATGIRSIGRKLWVPGVSEFDLMSDLTLVARYPQGLSPALRQKLLDSYRQSGFDIIEDRDPS